MFVCLMCLFLSGVSFPCVLFCLVVCVLVWLFLLFDVFCVFLACYVRLSFIAFSVCDCIVFSLLFVLCSFQFMVLLVMCVFVLSIFV